MRVVSVNPTNYHSAIQKSPWIDNKQGWCELFTHFPPCTILSHRIAVAMAPGKTSQKQSSLVKLQPKTQNKPSPAGSLHLTRNWKKWQSDCLKIESSSILKIHFYFPLWLTYSTPIGIGTLPPPLFILIFSQNELYNTLHYNASQPPRLKCEAWRVSCHYLQPANTYRLSFRIPHNVHGVRQGRKPLQ